MASKDQNDLVDRIIQEQQKLVTKANSAANGQTEIGIEIEIEIEIN